MRKYAKTLLGVVVSAAAVFAIVRNISLSDVARASAGASKSLVLAGIVALALGYAIRAFRWWRMLRLGNPSVTLGTTSRVLMAGFAANNVLPLRAGDVLRGFGFRGALNLPSSFVVATLALERLLDLFSLLLLGLCFIKFSAITTLPRNIVHLVEAFSLGSMVLLCLSLAFGKIVRRWLLLLVDTCIRQTEKHSKLELAITTLTSLFESISAFEAIHLTVLSVAAWFLEAVLYICVARALHLQAPFVWACMALVAANFAAIIPSSPGYVGTFHASVLAILLLAGVDRNAAAAYAVLVHGVLWLTITFAGAVAYFSLRVKAWQTLPDSRGEIV